MHRNDVLTPPPAPAIPGYRIDRLVGAGGQAEVWSARRDADDDELCLKIARPLARDALAAWSREVALQRAAGPVIAPELFGHGTTADGAMWIAMERVHGPTLAARIASDPLPWTCEYVADVLAPVLAVVQALHDREIVHGDLKPENVLLTGEGARLVDFGSAGAPTQSAMPLGATAEYVAPERCSTPARAMAQGDLYSLAVIAYELLTGAPPFWGPEEIVLEAHRSARPPSVIPVGLAPAFDAVLRTALDKRPEHRHASVAAFAAELLPRLREAGVMRARPVAGSQRGTAGFASSRAMSAVIWLRGVTSVARLQALLGEHRAVVAHVAKDLAVAAFVDDSPATALRRASTVAQTLVADESCTHALVDVQLVSVVPHLQPPRVLAPGFGQAARYPAAEDPPVCFTPAVAALVAEPRLVPLPDRDDRLVAVEDAAWPASTEVATTVELRGRHELLATLDDAARTATSGTPIFAVLTGEQGSGRSRLAAVLHERLAWMGMQTFGVQASDGTGLVGGAVARLAASLLGLADDERPLLQRVGAALNVRPTEVPRGLLLALGWFDEGDEALAAMRAAPGAIRNAVSTSLAELVVDRARLRPIAIVVDDADRVENELLDALTLATDPEAGARLLVCGLALPGFVDQRRDAGPSRTLHLEIAPLDLEATGLLVREALQPALNVPDAAIEEIHRRTRGLPLLVVELVRALRSAGALRSTADGRGCMFATEVLDRVPGAAVVQWVARQELDRLPRSLARHAAVVAAMGPDASTAALEAALCELEHDDAPLPTQLDPEVGLARLLRAGILRDDATVPVFRHDALRDLALASLERDARLRLHRAAYRAARKRDDGTRALAVWLHHASGAELHDDAAEHALVLAAHASTRHAYLEAEQCFGRACVHLDAAARPAAHALHQRGLMRFRLGRHDQARADLDRVLAMVADGDTTTDAALVLLDAATVEDWCQRFDRAALHVDAACRIATVPDAPTHARLALARGRRAFRAGGIDEATAELTTAVTAATALGDIAYETHVIALLMLAPLLAMTGHTDRALPLFEELFALSRAHGDRIHLASALVNRSLVWIELQRLDMLHQDLHEVIALSRASGFPLLECAARYNLGEIDYLVADYATARTHVEAAIELEGRLGTDRPGSSVARLLCARILARTGDLTAAAEIVAAMRTAQAGTADALAAADELLCCAIELSCSDADQHAWQSLIARSSLDSVQQERIEVLELAGLAAARAGDLDVARKWLARANDAATATVTLLRPRIEQALAELPPARRTA